MPGRHFATLGSNEKNYFWLEGRIKLECPDLCHVVETCCVHVVMREGVVAYCKILPQCLAGGSEESTKT